MKVRNDTRMTHEMRAAGIDAVVAFSMENVFYLSGALFALQDNLRERLACAGMTADGRDFLVCATNEMSVAEPQAHVGALRGYAEFKETALDGLAAQLGEWGLGSARIGVEKRYLMAAFYEELQALLPRARLVSGDGVIETARAIKTPEHIEIIGRNSRSTERAVAKALAETRAGDTEKRLAIRIITALFEMGAETMRHIVVTAGDNARHAHPYPSQDKVLTSGDIIRIDVGGLFQGYGTDIARMGVVGAPSEAQRRHYHILRTSQREVATALRPGARARDIYDCAVKAYAAQGVPGYQRDHVGHSLSILGGHDNPMLHGANEMVLEENMVMALEPIFRDAEGRRYTVEDAFVVTPQGGRLLTFETDTDEMTRVR